MNTLELLRALDTWDADIEKLQYLHKLSPRDAWEQCLHPEIMIWLLGELQANSRLFVAISCDMAETTLSYTPDEEVQLRGALETVRRWLKGEATTQDVLQAQAEVRTITLPLSVLVAVDSTLRAASGLSTFFTVCEDAALVANSAEDIAEYLAEETGTANTANVKLCGIVRAHVGGEALEALIASKFACPTGVVSTGRNP